MNKKELINRVVDVLHENDVRKKISAQKAVFHISDDAGNQSDFVVKKPTRGLLFTFNDVAAIVNACLAVVEDSLKRGEEISIPGFGAIGVHYREARRTKHPATGDDITIPAKYTPKFKFGNQLRMAAKVYEMSLAESEPLDALSSLDSDEEW